MAGYVWRQPKQELNRTVCSCGVKHPPRNKNEDPDTVKTRAAQHVNHDARFLGVMMLEAVTANA